MTVNRDWWHRTRDRLDHMDVLDEFMFLDLLNLHPSGWFGRACVIYIARQERELASDEQLRSFASRYGGKIARFIEGILIARRVRRDPADVAARRDAEAFGQAWLRARIT
jgi:hypothetical protein